MDDKPDFKLIQKARAAVMARREAIDHQMEALKAELEVLDRDAQELDMAERVLARYSKGDVPRPNAAPRVYEPSISVQTSGRPANIPTVNDMTDIVLREHQTRTGERFLEGGDIVREIRRRWWPSVKSNDVVPTLTKTAKKGRRFVKVGSRYALLESETLPLKNGSVA